MIVVTGATGKTGGEVVRLLTAKGIRVRALVRSPEKAKGITGPGVEVAVGDLEKPATLDPAFKGADKIFLVSSPDLRVGLLHGNALDAAKRAGVKQIVRLSAFGAVPSSTAGLLRVHGEVDERLSRSGLSFTILRPHAFYQNLLWAASTVAAEGTLYSPVRDGAVGMIDNRDVALVAVQILLTETHSGRIYDFTGPEALTYEMIAERLGATIGKPVRCVDITPAATRAALLGMGLPEWLADALLELYAIWGSGKASGVSDSFEKITGKKPRAFDVFAKDFASVFAGNAEAAAR
jgi:uncharacterized protein YbjT (DUF2867 family)